VTLARAYTAARKLSDDELEERRTKARLSPLAIDLSMQPERRLIFLQDLSEIRRINREIEGDATELLLNARQARLGYSLTKLHEDNAFLVDMERQLRGPCVIKPALSCRGENCS
jgi:hypothetical protein